MKVLQRTRDKCTCVDTSLSTWSGPLFERQVICGVRLREPVGYTQVLPVPKLGLLAMSLHNVRWVRAYRWVNTRGGVWARHGCSLAFRSRKFVEFCIPLTPHVLGIFGIRQLSCFPRYTLGCCAARNRTQQLCEFRDSYLCRCRLK